MDIRQVWTTQDTNIRDEPGARGRVMDIAGPGRMLEVLGDKGPWLHVRYGKTEGWVHASTITETDPSTVPDNAKPTRGPATKGAASTRRSKSGTAASAAGTANVAPQFATPPGTPEDYIAAQTSSWSNTDEDIRTAQEQLSKLGYDVAVDGIPGNQTSSAIRKFQADHELNATGRLNRETRAALLKADIVETIAPEARPPGHAASFAVSDSEAHNIDEDKLGFRNSVLALTDFLRAKETSAPLAIGVCAAWGRGKTSFMRMVDAELEKASGRTTRFTRIWFNPWKHDKENQVWAAFVAQLHKTIMQEIGFWPRQRFHLTTLLQRFQFNLRTVFSLIVLGLLVWLGVELFSPEMEALNIAVVSKLLGNEAGASAAATWFKSFMPWLASLFIVHLVYTRLTDMFGDTLLSFLKKTDYSDKIGALALFESEMRDLNAAIPDTLKIIVFIDDLDRCKPKILGQIIEAMQLLEVSRKCIFILGMDLGIVVRTVETKMKDENPEITFGTSVGDTSDPDGMAALGSGSNHGYGYRFLEKIIQLRLSVPSYDAGDMAQLASSLSGDVATPEETQAQVSQTQESQSEDPKSGANRPAGDDGPGRDAPDRPASTAHEEDLPSDSPEVQAAIAEYGSRYFRNPRRLKRFVNALRLHIYLARVDNLNLSVNEIARFLVLAEQWPGLVEELRTKPKHLAEFHDTVAKSSKNSLATAIRSNSELTALISGDDDLGPLDQDTLERLCRWTDFQIYH